MMRAASEGHRQQLLDGLRRFVASVQQMPGVRGIALLGSIVTAKPDPKDIDVLVVVADDADLAKLATCSRRLQGHAQSVNRGADVFLADESGTYIGRTCRWNDCRPGVRQSWDALHCGRRPYLHDDLDAIRLNSAVVFSPPVILWPWVERRVQLPPDVEDVVAALEHAVQGNPGHIVNITSGQGAGPMPGELAYVATKAALDALTMSLSVEPRVPYGVSSAVTRLQ